MSFKDIENQPALLITNEKFFFSKEELEHIEEDLNRANIKLYLLGPRGIQNSFFSGIEIILSSPLANLLIGGLLMPTIYDNLKKVIQLTINKVKKSDLRIITSKESATPNVIIKIPTKKGDIIASVDSATDISENELELYIETLVQAANRVDDNDNYNAIYRVIDKNTDGSLSILTLREYLVRHKKIKQ